MMRSVNWYSLNSVDNNFLDLLPVGCTAGDLLNPLVLGARDGTLKAEKNSGQPGMRCQWMISVDDGMVRPDVRVFFEMHKNGNNVNIGIRGFTT